MMSTDQTGGAGEAGDNKEDVGTGEMSAAEARYASVLGANPPAED